MKHFILQNRNIFLEIKVVEPFLLYAICNKLLNNDIIYSSLTIKNVDKDSYAVTLTDGDNKKIIKSPLKISAEDFPRNKLKTPNKELVKFYHLFHQLPYPKCEKEIKQHKLIQKRYQVLQKLLNIENNKLLSSTNSSCLNFFDYIHIKRKTMYFFYWKQEENKKNTLITVEYDIPSKEYIIHPEKLLNQLCLMISCLD